MSHADTVLTLPADATVQGLRLTRRGIAVLAALGGMAMGLILGAVLMQLPVRTLEHQLDQVQRESAELRQKAEIHVGVARQLVTVQQRAGELESQGKALLQASAAVLEEAQRMPAFKNPAYKEPFDRILAMLLEIQSQDIQPEASTSNNVPGLQHLVQRNDS